MNISRLDFNYLVIAKAVQLQTSNPLTESTFIVNDLLKIRDRTIVLLACYEVEIEVYRTKDYWL